jgi:hypothetical protein
VYITVTVMIKATELSALPLNAVAAGRTPSSLTSEPLGIPTAGINVLLMMTSGWAMVAQSPKVASPPEPVVTGTGSDSVLTTGGHRVVNLERSTLLKLIG